MSTGKMGTFGSAILPTSLKKKLPDDVSALASFYLERNSDFSQMLQERSSDEVAFDNEVLRWIRSGFGIRGAGRCRRQVPRRSAPMDRRNAARYPYSL